MEPGAPDPTLNALSTNPLLLSHPVQSSPSSVLESLWSCVSIYVNWKWPRIDFIVAQMWASYRRLVWNFFQIPFRDTQHVFLFLTQSNKSATVCRQSVKLWSNLPNISSYICPQIDHRICTCFAPASNTDPKWAMLSLSERMTYWRWRYMNMIRSVLGTRWPTLE